MLDLTSKQLLHSRQTDLGTDSLQFLGEGLGLILSDFLFEPDWGSLDSLLCFLQSQAEDGSDLLDNLDLASRVVLSQLNIEVSLLLRGGFCLSSGLICSTSSGSSLGGGTTTTHLSHEGTK